MEQNNKDQNLNHTFNEEKHENTELNHYSTDETSERRGFDSASMDDEEATKIVGDCEGETSTLTNHQEVEVNGTKDSEQNFNSETMSTESVRTSQNTHKKKVFSLSLKSLISNVSVAVISSLLTVSIFTYFQNADTDDSGNGNEVNAETTQLDNNENTAQVTSKFIGTDSATIADIAEELAPAIVGIVNLKEVQFGYNAPSQNVNSGTGSGVIYKLENDKAYIITNNHVIEGANKVEVSLYNGETAEAEVVGSDALTDLAVLKIDGNLVDRIAAFGDSSNLRPGDEVIAIGNPLGLEFSRTVTQGIISATERNISVNTSAGAWELSVLQTDAAINPGNSGGALINSRGEVIGINSLKISEEGVEGLGFAIPSNDVMPIAEELIEHGEIKRAYIGVQLYDMKDIAQFYRQSFFGSLNEGIVIAGVEEGSPAGKAGLQVNDVIVGIDGNKVSDSGDFKQYLYKNVKPGETVKVEFYREGKKQTAEIETKGN